MDIYDESPREKPVLIKTPVDDLPPHTRKYTVDVSYLNQTLLTTVESGTEIELLDTVDNDEEDLNIIFQRKTSNVSQNTGPYSMVDDEEQIEFIVDDADDYGVKSMMYYSQELERDLNEHRYQQKKVQHLSIFNFFANFFPTII